jgi:hypothetical protein
MNTAMKSAIALGAVSFGITLWVLRAGHSVPRSAPAPQLPAVRRETEPTQPARDAARSLPPDFGPAVQAAERVGSTPEGLKYQDEAGPVLSKVLQERLSSCLSDSSPLGQAGFTIVVGVAPDGAVRSTWASPETSLASCVLHRLAGAALPPPQIPDVWLAANIRPDATASEAEPER